MGNSVARFIALGAAITVAGYIFFSLSVFLGLSPYFAIIFGSFVFTTIRYLAYRFLVFEKTKSTSSSALRFIAVTIGLMVTNNAFFFALHEVMLLNEYVSQLIAIVVLAGISFLVQRRYLF